MKAESAMAYPIPVVAGYGQSFQDGSPTFSMDDFEGNILLLVYVVSSGTGIFCR